MPSLLTVRMGAHAVPARPTTATATASALLAGPNPKPSAGNAAATVAGYTAAPTTGFDAGMTYTTTNVPTGAGWTDGTDCHVAMQALIDGVADGSSTTSHRRFLFPAGYTWVIGVGINLTGRAHLTFEGGGTETTYGHTGGAVIRATGSAALKTSSVFYWKSGTTSASGSDFRFHGLTAEGNSTKYATTAAADDGEYQCGWCNFGADDIYISHCIVDKVQGRGVNIAGSQDGFTSGEHQPDGFELRNSTLRNIGAMGVSLVHGRNVTVDTCEIKDIGYAPFDYEPDFSFQNAHNLTYTNNLISGTYSWDSSQLDPCWQNTSVAAATLSGTYTVSGNTISAIGSGGSDPAGTFFGLDSDIVKTAVLTFTNNTNTGADTGTAQTVYMTGWSSNGHTVTGNTGFGSSTFLYNGGGNGTITNSGNS